MITELSKVRETLHRSPTCCGNMTYFNQLVYLRNSIKPKDIAISGAGFFSLNRPLLVSLSGALITYTVILVQTSGTVGGGSAAP
ncbi:hypothetical protein V5799_020811 [Amblyomma americanum]|uniref:Uncharacterized protein n=1 Tax=Amblyomma americanum TaxID=6943 RepID=A0AAQ4ET06_AMBAM